MSLGEVAATGESPCEVAKACVVVPCEVAAQGGGCAEAGQSLPFRVPAGSRSGVVTAPTA